MINAVQLCRMEDILYVTETDNFFLKNVSSMALILSTSTQIYLHICLLYYKPYVWNDVLTGLKKKNYIAVATVCELSKAL